MKNLAPGEIIRGTCKNHTQPRVRASAGERFRSLSVSNRQASASNGNDRRSGEGLEKGSRRRRRTCSRTPRPSRGERPRPAGHACDSVRRNQTTRFKDGQKTRRDRRVPKEDAQTAKEYREDAQRHPPSGGRKSKARREATSHPLEGLSSKRHDECWPGAEEREPLCTAGRNG